MKELMALIPANFADWSNYMIYLAIAVVSLIGVWKCLLPLWGTTHALRRAIRRLQDEAGENRDVPVWQENRFMGRRLKGSWIRFLQNAEQLDRRGLPCNVEDYINDDTVTHGPGNAQLAELIPSLLTSLGILGTFMGMTSGLGGLDPSSTESMMTGIKTLLTGMQFAFGTSVAGVSCSLVFNMLNRIAQGSSYHAIDDFVESFTQLAMQRPLDNDVQMVCQNQDRNHMLNSVTETISNTMSVSIETAIGRAMQPIASSMDNFLIGATRAQVEGVSRIVNNFVDHMNASLNDQFLALGQTLSGINQQQAVSQQQLQQSMLNAQQLLATVQQMNGISRDVITHFEHYISEISDARHRDEHFEVNVTELLNHLRQVSDEQVASINGIRQGQHALETAMTQYLQICHDTTMQMQHVGEENARQLAVTAGGVADASRKLGQSYEHFVQDVVNGLSKSLGMFDESMHSAVGALSEQLHRLEQKDGDQTRATELGEVQRLLADIQKTLEKASSAAEQKED